MEPGRQKEKRRASEYVEEGSAGGCRTYWMFLGINREDCSGQRAMESVCWRPMFSGERKVLMMMKSGHGTLARGWRTQIHQTLYCPRRYLQPVQLVLLCYPWQFGTACCTRLAHSMAPSGATGNAPFLLLSFFFFCFSNFFFINLLVFIIMILFSKFPFKNF